MSDAVPQVIFSASKKTRNHRYKEFENDKMTELIFEIEHEILKSQQLREEKFSSPSLHGIENLTTSKPKKEFINPLEKIQKVKMDSLSSQIGRYKQLYFSSKIELQNLKVNIKDHEEEIETSKHKCQNMKEDILNKTNIIKSLECQLNMQRNQFLNKQAKLKHKISQKTEFPQEKTQDEGYFNVNQSLKEECEKLKKEKKRLKEKLTKLKESFQNYKDSNEEAEKWSEECEGLRKTIKKAEDQQMKDKVGRESAYEKFEESKQMLMSLEGELKKLRNCYEDIEKSNQTLDWEIEERIKNSEKTEKRNFEEVEEKIREQQNNMERIKRDIEEMKSQSSLNEGTSRELKEVIDQRNSHIRENWDNCHLEEKINEIQMSLKGFENIPWDFIQQQRVNFETEIAQKQLLNNVMSQNTQLKQFFDKFDSNEKQAQNLQVKLEECEAMLLQLQNTTATSLNDALSTTMRMKHQLNDIENKTEKFSENSIKEDIKRENHEFIENWREMLDNCQQKFYLVGGKTFVSDEGPNLEYWEDYMNHIRSIEERSIRLRRLISEIRNGFTY